MDTTQNFSEEYAALQKLEFYFGNNLNNFEKHEEPDFWNEKDDIGLEITQSNFDGEQTKILQQIHGKNYTYEEAIEVLNKYDKKGKFKGQIGRITPTSDEFYSSPTKGMVNTNIYFDEIIKCINVKLDKLQHFKNFKEKFLCIIDHGHTIEKFDLKDYILPKIIETENNYNDKYKGYFIIQYDKIYTVIKHKILLDVQIQQ